VTSIAAATPDSIQLKTTSGITIVWGDASQSALKAQVAVALLDSGAKTTIDVSAPHNPAVR
jgi:cell division protein FtsQ